MYHPAPSPDRVSNRMDDLAAYRVANVAVAEARIAGHLVSARFDDVGEQGVVVVERDRPLLRELRGVAEQI